tara:strand:+ start:281 stop:1903 length:1623 start_codon:yes stop_codon:yes gene_type:complete
MAKLDEKALDELIKEVLNERTYIKVGDLKKKVKRDGKETTVPDDDTWRKLVGAQSTSKAPSFNQLDALRKLDGSQNALEPEDFDDGAALPPDKPARKAVEKFANDDAYLTTITDLGKAIRTKARKELAAASGRQVASAADTDDIKGAGDVDITNVAAANRIGAATRQDIVGFDLRNAESGIGNFPQALINVYEAMFGNEKTLIGRINRLTEFSQKILTGSKSEAAAKAEFAAGGFKSFVTNVMAMDHINSIAKSLDNDTGAYMFESFLALIAGGKVTGKDKTAAGQMGAADFSIAGTDGKAVRGSAKYYNQLSGIEQSSKGFDDGDNKAVHYIVGLKKDVVDAAGPSESGISDPLKLKSVDLYYIIIHYVGEDSENRKVFVVRDPDLKELGLEVVSGEGAVKLNKTAYYVDSTKIGTLVLAENDSKKYREMVQATADNVSKEFSTAMEKVKETFSKNQDFKDSTSDYVADGGVNKGNKMITNLNELLSGVQSMIDALKVFGSDYEAPTDKIKAPAPANPVSEAKLAQLDKLILEVLKNNH